MLASHCPSALQVRCGKPSVTNSAVPRTTSSMPSVTRNEGILRRVTNSPLMSPISAATTRLITNATPSEVRPALNSVHITTGAKPNSEPTERSNSPAVISSVIASAMSPSSTVKVSVLLMLRIDRKSGLIAVKTTSSTMSSTNGPNSGAEMSRRSWRFFCTRLSPIDGADGGDRRRRLQLSAAAERAASLSRPFRIRDRAEPEARLTCPT